MQEDRGFNERTEKESVWVKKNTVSVLDVRCAIHSFNFWFPSVPELVLLIVFENHKLKWSPDLQCCDVTSIFLSHVVLGLTSQAHAHAEEPHTVFDFFCVAGFSKVLASNDGWRDEIPLIFKSRVKLMSVTSYSWMILYCAVVHSLHTRFGWSHPKIIIIRCENQI